MTRRRLRWVALVLVLSVGALVLATRVAGVAIKTSDGRLLGYHPKTQQWLAREYPAFPASVDGPYVYTEAGKRHQLRLARSATGEIAAERSPLSAAEVQVEVDQADGRRFAVPLRNQHPRGATTLPMPARLLMASDFEGNFQAFTALMQGNGVLDEQLHWSFGTGEVVLVGDLVDRGRNVLPLLWLVYRMEAEAKAAGGAVHYVLGNHEQKLLTGVASDVDTKYLGTLRLAGQSHASLWDANSELGRWLRSKPVLLKVGNYLFTHGGVSADVLALRPSLDEVDRHADRWLASDPREVTDARAKAILWDGNGVLWYRGLAMAMNGNPKAPRAHVDQVLRHFDVKHLVIGHTLASHVGSDYDGAVLRVDVHHAAGTVEGLLVEDDGMPQRVGVDGKPSVMQAAVNLD